MRLRYTFRKKERLSRKKAFSYLFEHGDSLNAGMLKFFYAFNVPEGLLDSPCGIAFSVPKRNFKRAVDRNLLKRRLREAFRLHKHDLYTYLGQEEKNLALLVKYQPRKIHPYSPIEKGMKKGLKKLIQLKEGKNPEANP